MGASRECVDARIDDDDDDASSRNDRVRSSVVSRAHESIGGSVSLGGQALETRGKSGR